ncbi:bifunctional adenosylcobinamide kinase/adenosylcobinamide-phosphate guanylyltransferase [Oceanospirillum linum]|uniref:Bifunctional adenosylcobalamin biosynthesis protein n=1 Tax=Oceanospirillum linum TaxID=966 RepID=A0A1T1HEN5_OCELI|nr:bifunctional adenosylcobinamide kinase/adenosylcobinamide-phosphate guanylyltransferase [Oceanospirillum linum]OOV88293.1 bifunctional adenosylcobinamide kinase/adenosylcobinamide-phosphate guanylyltransferase [Oceanospirillum linum]SEF51251.1 adenosylcobinamide kinase /adenosylcobinamide-phosphate guanylyltransferase [Oleiphilus messinensis]SMP04009.1 adenosylcobinamide kinase /adenosylcobinamide-phosphate guanylyltransferase [Oceanospirillum linum]
MISFILGGARSGKSGLAEKIASCSGLPVHYLATAQVWDDEMANRVRHHQTSRPAEWPTIEAPLDILPVIKLRACDQKGCVLLDCLTLWMTNLLLLDDDQALIKRQEDFLSFLRKGVDGHLILVSNEVGQGVVPTNKLARRFVDESGRLHQKIAEIADEVIFVTAGIPQILKTKIDDHG